MPKPSSAFGYRPEQRALVEATCLYVATKLGDLLDDIVVVGGLVPSLLLPPETLPESERPHVGTMDLDVGLALGLLDGERYAELAARLRAAGLVADQNENQNPTRQRWRHSALRGVSVDFLMPPASDGCEPGTLQNLEADFAALITLGLDLAFEDRREVILDGLTLEGARAKRRIFVCGPAAFVVLKLIAFRNRGENKDAYDLYYVIRNHPEARTELPQALVRWGDHPAVQQAIEILDEDFLDPDEVGPARVAQFLYDRLDATTQTDVATFCSELSDACRAARRN